MSTLPRLRPKTFNDLAVAVSLIQPGPIQRRLNPPLPAPPGGSGRSRGTGTGRRRRTPDGARRTSTGRPLSTAAHAGSVGSRPRPRHEHCGWAYGAADSSVFPGWIRSVNSVVAQVN
ncbi:hypothetical protein [Streptomyces eurocidicus]|uniref:hypothetical protein n=1 Tax=Streptomyces eurocidicus TaxID=66423 RepID=UPI0035DAC976